LTGCHSELHNLGRQQKADICIHWSTRQHHTRFETPQMDHHTKHSKLRGVVFFVIMLCIFAVCRFLVWLFSFHHHAANFSISPDRQQEAEKTHTHTQSTIYNPRFFFLKKTHHPLMETNPKILEQNFFLSRKLLVSQMPVKFMSNPNPKHKKQTSIVYKKIFYLIPKWGQKNW
jgi:hypothetical protein